MKKSGIAAIGVFVTDRLWKARLDELPRPKAMLVRTLRVLVLAVSGFSRDRASIQAAALTFYSLLSLVPVIALAIGIAKGFGFDRVIRQEIAGRLAFQPGVADFIFRFVGAFLEQTRTGLIAGVGVAVLFWTVISALGNIEQALNGIWGIPVERSLTRKFSDYLSMVLVGTVLLIISSSLNVAVTAEARTLIGRLGFTGTVQPLFVFLLGLLSYLAVWLLFSLMYLFMPNTKVDPAAGVAGGIVAGTAYQVLQWIYIHFQINVASYSAVYGSFAALPLFIAWVQLSWSIFLFGAEIVHGVENAETYGFSPFAGPLNDYDRQAALVRIMRCLAAQFVRGDRPLDTSTLSRRLHLPRQLVQDDTVLLQAAGLVNETPHDHTGLAAYQPAKDPDALTVFAVLDAVRRHGSSLPEVDREGTAKMRAALEALTEAERHSPGNVSLKDL